MAATGTPTPNIGLRIPLGTDPASVDDINYNSNLLDTKLGAVGNDSVQDQIDTLNSNMTWNTVDISNCSTIQSVFSALDSNNLNVVGQANIGSQESNSFKTLVGNPGISNYASCTVRVIPGLFQTMVAECIASSKTNSVAAIKRKYLWINGTNMTATAQSAWETISAI